MKDLLGARVRESFRAAAGMSVAVMLAFTVLCQLASAAMVRAFSPDPAVVALGSEYLRIVSVSFAGSGLVFVTSSVFQGMGHTLPPLGSSALRLLLFALPAYALSHRPGFEMRYVWCLSVASVAVQVCVNLWLLHREFDTKLAFAAVAQPPPAVAEA